MFSVPQLKKDTNMEIKDLYKIIAQQQDLINKLNERVTILENKDREREKKKRKKKKKGNLLFAKIQRLQKMIEKKIQLFENGLILIKRISILNYYSE